ncbi:outer membrane receptor protein involved in Fe transport [Sphingobium xenophagum]|uniref:Outer membrane receptor protein involved in Fe transport n=1 Tax=Sphingobium xenophagum TaxID=121428 RepID=A0ABU1X532_SPHXE|nr:TonB-dependent receptor [Sphingobium xenophagum]MDR7156693.1 outer membrane receptor protein involved in Fe transport [Sphingobium xenophagum]
MKMRAILMASAAISCTIGFGPSQAARAQNNATASQGPAQTASEQEVGEIIVTAQKRAQSVNDVGLSITAVSGDTLTSRGVNDPSQLAKLVSGFNYNETASGNPVYSIRGVGYQDSSVAASPAVTVYVDEVPISFSGGTLGASLDIERVEVLKGPQGTLYGGNSTGGAINYIAAKPMNTLSAGANWEFGRFTTSNLTGFVSGPVTDTLSVRLSGRWLKSGSWQKSYTRDDKIGAKDQLFGRIIADWHPTDKLKIQLNVNGWRDHSESQAGQLITQNPAVPLVPLDPVFAAYPLAPANARAADWDPTRDYQHRDSFWQVSGRINYEASDDLTLTSISAYQVYKRYSPNDFSGTSVPVLFQISSGKVKTFFQELRASMSLAETGNLTVGANYQSDSVDEQTHLFVPAGTPRIVGGTNFVNQNSQEVKAKGIFASGDLPILPELSIVGGIRYTKVNHDYSGCTRDSGDGSAAAAFTALLGGALGFTIQPGQCFTLQDNLQPGLFVSSLDQDNVSWRAGLNYKPDRDMLLYVSVSRGFKSQNYQSLAAATANTLSPVVQEKLTAYEAGFKLGLLDRRLQLNGAAFYYDYANKQIRSIRSDLVLQGVEALVNIPKSRVQGFEFSAAVRPLSGLSVSSAITYVDSKVRGAFIGLTPSSIPADFNGQAFPYTPKWSGNTDVEYRWALSERLNAVLGATATYNSSTNGGFGEEALYRVKGYTLVDLRAEIEGGDGRWRAGIWGRNITNEYYWYTATRASDSGTRFAGMPATYGVSFGFRY